MNAPCEHCGARVPEGFADCQAVFDQVCALEYGDTRYAGAHLMTVDVYVLQHSANHGPRSNAFHLLRLCRVIEQGGDPAIGKRPPRSAAKAFERHYRDLPYLAPPAGRAMLTIADVQGATTPEEHVRRVGAFAKSVWDAWAVHHAWARQWIQNEPSGS